MKKILFLILIFLFPIFVEAEYSIDDYRVDITVLENGDINVIEAFSMSGLYNGYERIVNYKNNYKGYFGSKIASVEDVSLYDYKDIVLNEVRSIDFSYEDDLLINSNLFEKVNTAKKGEYGLYTILKNEDGYSYKIYNPSKMNKDFYISYDVKNAVIVHNDIAELSFNEIGYIQDDINHLEININIPSNENLLKIWLHGNFSEKIEIIDNNKIKIIIDNLQKFSNLDFRIIFDKETILDVNKKSNEDVLNKIIELENKFNLETNIIDENYELVKEQAYNAITKASESLDKTDYDQAVNLVKNLKDDDFKTDLLVKLMNLEQRVERHYVFSKVICTSIMGIFIIGLFIIIYQIYKNNDIYKNNYLNEKIDYIPTTISYLLRRKIDNEDLYPSILYLIYNKNIDFVETRTKKDYKFIKLSCENLDDSLNKLIKIIFDDKDEITLSKLKKNLKLNSSDLLIQYSNWLNAATEEAIAEKFYKDLLGLKIFGISYSLIAIVISSLLLNKITYFSPVITIVIFIFAIFYFSLFHKKTYKGNSVYSKLLVLKKNILDSETISFDYYIYSILFRNNEKISKKINKNELKKYKLINDLFGEIYIYKKK